MKSYVHSRLTRSRSPDNNGLHTEPFLGRVSMLCFLYGSGEPGRYPALVMHFVSLLVALAAIAVAVVHEICWWRRRSWTLSTGIVVSETEHDDAIVPEIEFTFHGKAKRFVSNYGGRGVGVGAKVNVLYDPETGDAEQLKWSNRWLPTAALLIFASLWVWAGVATWPIPE